MKFYPFKSDIIIHEFKHQIFILVEKTKLYQSNSRKHELTQMQNNLLMNHESL